MIGIRYEMYREQVLSARTALRAVVDPMLIRDRRTTTTQTSPIERKGTWNRGSICIVSGDIR